MLRKQKGFTLIELLIVIAIIGILAAIAIPMYKAQTIKAKLTEVTNAMSNVCSAVAAYYNENQTWPGVMTGATVVRNSLGVAFPTARTSGAGANPTITAATGRITVIVGNIDADVNASTLILSPTIMAADSSIRWTWEGTMRATYLPKR